MGRVSKVSLDTLPKDYAVVYIANIPGVSLDVQSIPGIHRYSASGICCSVVSQEYPGVGKVSGCMGICCGIYSQEYPVFGIWGYSYVPGVSW